MMCNGEVAASHRLQADSLEKLQLLQQSIFQNPELVSDVSWNFPVLFKQLTRAALQYVCP
jgi:hypothetical protein